jgi:WD40 repeat protein
MNMRSHYERIKGKIKRRIAARASKLNCTASSMVCTGEIPVFTKTLFQQNQMCSAELVTFVTVDRHEAKNSKSLLEMLSVNLSQVNSRGTLLACLDDKFISVYNPSMTQPRYKFSVDLVKYVQDMTFLSRTQLVISSTYIGSKVVVWDLDLNKITKTIDTQGINLCVSGQYCIMSDKAVTLKVWNTETGKLKQQPTTMHVLDLKVHATELLSLQIFSGTIYIGTWDIATLDNTKLISVQHGVQVSPWRSGITPIYTGMSCETILYTLDTNMNVVAINTGDYNTNTLISKLSDEKCMIAEPTVGTDSKLVLYNMKTLEEEFTVLCSAYAVVGNTVMYASNGVIHVLEVTLHGNQERTFTGSMKKGAVWVN